MNTRKLKDTILSLVQNQQFPQAITACETLCKELPHDANVWVLAATTLHQCGHIEQARRHYQKAININSEIFDAHAHLGNIFLQQNKLQAAAQHFQKATCINSKHPYAWCNLGLTLGALGEHKRAIECYKTALQLAPDIAQIHVMLGNAYTACSQYEAALKHHQQARKLQPENMDAVAGEANSLERLGKQQEAWSLIKPFTDKPLSNIALAISYATLSKKFNAQEQAIEQLQQLLKSPALNDMQRMEIHFALGNLCDNKNDYSVAFNHYQQANQLVSRNYKANHERSSTDQAIASYTPELIQRLQTFGNPSIQPIFIIGMPRSGTSLIEKIIASHNDVYGAGELHNIISLTHELSTLLKSESSYPVCLQQIDSKNIKTLSQQYLEYLNTLPENNESRIIDKMPHNFLHLGLIHILFPKAKIIHSQRNPIDTCLSCYFQNFGGSNDYAYNLKSLGQHYQQYRRYMDHWRQLNIPMIEINYEDMIEEQEKTTRKLLEYCELEWDDACLKFHQSSQTTRTASYDQVRQPIYKQSVQRWKNYEPYLSELINSLRAD